MPFQKLTILVVSEAAGRDEDDEDRLPIARRSYLIETPLLAWQACAVNCRKSEDFCVELWTACVFYNTSAFEDT